jgi:hypothetical protein
MVGEPLSISCPLLNIAPIKNTKKTHMKSGLEKIVTFILAHLVMLGKDQCTSSKETQSLTKNRGLYISRLCSAGNWLYIFSG